MDQYTFNLDKNPYSTGSMFSNTKITFNKGLNILVGCNGSGKTTALTDMQNKLLDEKIPTLYYDNVNNGGSSNYSSFAFYGMFEELSDMMSSSEGEKITKNLGINFISKIKQKSKKCTEKNNNLFLLIDAVDSGYSIDNIVELKELFKDIILEMNNQGIDLFIIASANSYEFANGENCIDIARGKNIKFNNYEEYKKFILSSRKRKEARNRRFRKHQELEAKKEEKEKLNNEVLSKNNDKSRYDLKRR